MNARLLFVATTLSVAGAFGSIAGCTISTTDNSNDASTPNGSSSGGSKTDAGTDSGDGGDGGGSSGECLSNKERGPFCHADETPEVPAKCASECDTASTTYLPDVARAISDCIDDAIGDATPTPALCEEKAAPCVAAATELACESDTTDFCNGVIAKCSDAGSGDVITKAECTQYFNGATVAGKQLLLDCLNNEKDAKLCTACMNAIKTVHSGD